MLEINIIREIGKNIYDFKNWAIENPQSEMQRGKKNGKKQKNKKKAELTPKNYGKISKRFNMHVIG